MVRRAGRNSKKKKWWLKKFSKILTHLPGPMGLKITPRRAKTTELTPWYECHTLCKSHCQRPPAGGVVCQKVAKLTTNVLIAFSKSIGPDGVMSVNCAGTCRKLSKSSPLESIEETFLYVSDDVRDSHTVW